MVDHLPYSLDFIENEDKVYVRGRESDTLFVFFTCWKESWKGVDDKYNFDFLNTTVRTNLSAMCLRDTSNLWYHFGVRGIDGNIDAIAALIRAEARNYDKLVTMGISMGGYAALLFGQLCGADSAIGIVPQVRIGTRAANAIRDFRFGKFYAEVEERTTTPQFLSIDSALADGGKTRIVAIFGDQDEADRGHAKILSDNPFATNVCLENVGHTDIGRVCLSTGFLFQFFDGRFLSSRDRTVDYSGLKTVLSERLW